MSFIRSSLFTGALLAIASPAAAQITAEGLWKSWEATGKDAGYTLNAGETSRDGDRLVLRNVSADLSSDAVSSKVSVAEIVLRELGDGRVEMTTSPQWDSETVVKEDGKAGTPVRTLLTQQGYKVIVSGTEDQPVYDLSADSISFAQKLTISDEAGKAEGAMNTSGTLTGITGNFRITANAPLAMSYTSAADSFRLVMKTDADTDGTKANIALDMANLTSDFTGVLPAMDAGTEDLTSLLKLGMNGVSSTKTGPVSFSADITSPETPFKGEGRFAATEFGFGMKPDAANVLLDLQGVELGAKGETPSEVQVKIEGDAVLDPAAVSDDQAFKHGQVTVNVAQAEALLGMIQASGLIGQEEIMGMQMMMAMFTRPGPTPGSLTAKFEMTETGDLLINGQSMQ